jgi:eukaryotic-like serine/threonine-protein kinase
MGRSPGERLTPDLAREVCQRVGSKVYLSAEISDVGNQYAMTFNGIDCNTGNSVLQAQVTATDKEHVLKAVDAASSKLRRRLGESLATVEKLNAPLEQATTASLEALKAFSGGMKMINEKGDAEAIPFFRRAVELDPAFAMAYASLGTAYYNLGQGRLAMENMKRAFELRDRVSERERLIISANYAGIVTGDLLQEIQAYEVWGKVYQRDYAPHTNLGADYASLGQYSKALEQARLSIELEPNNVIPYLNLAQSYIALNDLEDAKVAFNHALARKLDAWFLHVGLYELAFLEGDAKVMQREADWSTGKPEAESWMVSLQADTAGSFDSCMMRRLG